jgi:hypothetical protein
MLLTARLLSPAAGNPDGRADVKVFARATTSLEVPNPMRISDVCV